MKYLYKMAYVYKIITPDCTTQREIFSDNKINLHKGDYVTINGTDYLIRKISYEHNFDNYTQICFVYLDEVVVWYDYPKRKWGKVNG